MRVFLDILSRVALAFMMALVGYIFTQQMWVCAVILALNLILNLCVDRRMNRAVHARLRLQNRYPVKFLPDRVVDMGTYKVVFPGRKTRDLLLECISMNVYKSMGKNHGGLAEDFYASVNAGKFVAQALAVTDKQVQAFKGAEICTVVCDELTFPVSRENFDKLSTGDLLVGLTVEGFEGTIQVYLPDTKATWHILLWQKNMDNEFRRRK